MTPYVISQQSPQGWGYTDEARLRGLEYISFGF